VPACLEPAPRWRSLLPDLRRGGPGGGRSSRGAGEERRIVTVMFADIVGFTTRSDGCRSGGRPANAPAVPRAVKQDIERFGGTLDKFIGDAAMGVFGGARRARQDDPERAVGAALRILDHDQELNEEDATLDIQRGGSGDQHGEAFSPSRRGPSSRRTSPADVREHGLSAAGIAPPGGM